MLQHHTEMICSNAAEGADVSDPFCKKYEIFFNAGGVETNITVQEL
jgi:hypothetical protein